MGSRIQRKRTAGWRAPEGARYVGRGSKYGNPFAVGETINRESPLWPYIADHIPGGTAQMVSVTPLSRETVVAAYLDWVIEQPLLMLSIPGDLGGRDLMCWCPLPEPGEPDHCHARVLMELAAGEA